VPAVVVPKEPSKQKGKPQPLKASQKQKKATPAKETNAQPVVIVDPPKRGRLPKAPTGNSNPNSCTSVGKFGIEIYLSHNFF
jgi:hypothetical protein